jgi:hypothetical protein
MLHPLVAITLLMKFCAKHKRIGTLNIYEKGFDLHMCEFEYYFASISNTWNPYRVRYVPVNKCTEQCVYA